MSFKSFLILLAVAVLVSVSLQSVSVSAAPNLIENGGFEGDGISPWVANDDSYDSSQFIQCGVDDQHSGQCNLLQESPCTTCGLTSLAQTVTVALGRSYTLSFWIRSSTSTDNTFSVTAKYGKAKAKTVFTKSNIPQQSQYVHHTLTLKTPVTGSKSLTLRLITDNAEGYFDIDDVSLKLS